MKPSEKVNKMIGYDVVKGTKEEKKILKTSSQCSESAVAWPEITRMCSPLTSEIMSNSISNSEADTDSI